MRISEIPDEALSLPATPVPTKTIYDWDALLEIMQRQGFVIIESTDIRRTKMGADESVPVKMFNSHLRQNKGLLLRTKRISKTRWFCCL